MSKPHKNHLPRLLAASAAGLLTLSLSGCVITGDASGVSAPNKSQALSGASSVSAFSQTLYPYARTNCIACHGNSQSPRFAVSDVNSAHDAALGVVNFTTPNLSTIYRKAEDGHCGGNCIGKGAMMVSLINAWAAAMADNGDHGGEDVEIGNVFTAKIKVPLPNVNNGSNSCNLPSDLACGFDGIKGGVACTNTCWSQMRFRFSGMMPAITDPAIKRAWFQVDFAYENYASTTGPASYVLRNPRVITPDGAVYIFDVKTFINGTYRSTVGTAYHSIDTVVDKTLFDANLCPVPAYPATINFTSLRLDLPRASNPCIPSSQPLFSTSSSASGILQERTNTTNRDEISFSFVYLKQGVAGDCKDLTMFQNNVFNPISIGAMACLDCHRAGGNVAEAGMRFNMDPNDVANGANYNARMVTICKRFLQRSNFAQPAVSPIIVQPRQGLNGMPAQANFDVFAPDWTAWIQREGSLR